MGKIHLISSVGICRKVVHKILCSNHRILAMSCKQVETDQPGALVLLTIGTMDGNVYIFDMKHCKDVMTDGQLWRILQSEELIKVIHDCRNTSVALQQQFSLTMRNVFDTQAAYCITMMQRELPPRFIHLIHLYEKFGDPAQEMKEKLQESHQEGGLFWGRRPLSSSMLRSAATEVLVLIPALYENLKKAISPAHENILSELCYAYIHGKFQSRLKPSSESRQQKCPILRLTESQQHLLVDTIPQGLGALTYR